MKSIKNSLLILLVVIGAGTVFTSCEKDDDYGNTFHKLCKNNKT